MGRIQPAGQHTCEKCGLTPSIARKITRWQATFSHTGVGQDSWKSGHEEQLNDLRHGVDVMKYHEIRDQAIVIDHLVLLMA